MFFLLIKTIEAAISATQYSPFKKHAESFQRMGEMSTDQLDISSQLQGFIPYHEKMSLIEFQRIFKVSVVGVPNLDSQYFNFGAFLSSKMAEYKLLIHYVLKPLLQSKDFAKKREFFKFFRYDGIAVDQLIITAHLQSLHRVAVASFSENFDIRKHVNGLFLKLNVHPTLQKRILNVIQPYIEMIDDLLAVEAQDHRIFEKFQYYRSGGEMFSTEFLKDVAGHSDAPKVGRKDNEFHHRRIPKSPTYSSVY